MHFRIKPIIFCIFPSSIDVICVASIQEILREFRSICELIPRGVYFSKKAVDRIFCVWYKILARSKHYCMRAPEICQKFLS